MPIRLLCLLILLLPGSCRAHAGTVSGPQAPPLHAWNFDRVKAPALPPDWRARVQGPVPGWRSVVDWTDSPPNAAHARSGRRHGVSALYSPVVALPRAEFELRFRHRWVVEPAPLTGGVLEIAIGGGDFVDILDAGGHFRAGGYNNTVLRCCGRNPIGGRHAWSSPSQPRFLATRVDLPAAVAGRSVQFRWRFGSSDGAVDAVRGGWWIDSIELDFAPPPAPLRLGLASTAASGRHVAIATRIEGRDGFSRLNPSGTRAPSLRPFQPLPEEFPCSVREIEPLSS